MDLSIIIVSYKSREKLANCLVSLASADMTGLIYEVIIVDNASGDDLSAFASQPNVKLVTSPKNLGMGGGNNLGLVQAAGEYVLILNPDTIIKGSALKTLLNYLRVHPEAGLAGPKLLNPDGSLQYSCSRFPTFFVPILRRTFLGDYFKKTRDSFMMLDFDHDATRAVDWLMGSCLMFKKEILLSDGQIWRPHFDERYFMYFEDIDLCRQMAVNGLKVIYDPEAILTHDHARESAKHPWYIALWHDSLTWHHIASWLKYFIKWIINKNKYANH